MPIYEYECRDHGVFEELRNMSERAEPAPCPRCEVPAARIVSVPTLARMAKSQVVARDRNERSRHEPRVAAHPGACQHDHGRRPVQTVRRETRVYQGPRPWVVEHA